MESQLQNYLKLASEPVAVLLTNEAPAGALQSREGQWSCVIPFMLAASKGKVCAFSRRTTGCVGGKVGLGFGAYRNYPDGIEYFLSTGKAGVMEGEHYKQTPELADDFVNCLPITDIPYEFVVFKPLSLVEEKQETPVLVVLYVNPDQLAALTVLANFHQTGYDNVIAPFAAGCQSVFLLPYAEAQQEKPRAVIGLLDITVRPMVQSDKLSFTMPYSLFQTMEQHAAASFLGHGPWQKICERL